MRISKYGRALTRSKFLGSELVCQSSGQSTAEQRGEAAGCSIYAKLPLRNDGPGDDALLSRRASSASSRITPELLSLARGQRTKRRRSQVAKEKAKKKRNENRGLACPEPDPDLILLQQRDLLSLSLSFCRYIYFFFNPRLFCTSVIGFTFPTLLLDRPAGAFSRGTRATT